MKTPTDVYFDQLRELHSVEAQLILALPELAAAATSPDLRRLLQDQESRAQRQKTRIEAVFERHGKPIEGKICEAMKGLVKGGHRRIASAESTAVRDLLLVAYGMRMRHYEMAGYGFVANLAEHLGFLEDAAALFTSLAESTEAQNRLVKISAGVCDAGTPAHASV